SNGRFKMMNCQIQNSGGTIFESSGSQLEFDTCFINATVLFDSSTSVGANMRFQKCYVAGDMSFSGGYSILADYSTFGSQVTNGSGGSAIIDVTMNFCFITSGTLINNT